MLVIEFDGFTVTIQVIHKLRRFLQITYNFIHELNGFYELHELK
jgi:hypothetical protein